MPPLYYASAMVARQPWIGRPPRWAAANSAAGRDSHSRVDGDGQIAHTRRHGTERDTKEEPMRAGLRAWDADTHVNPAAEVLERYVDPSFRPRLPELASYRIATGQMMGGTPDTHQYRIGTKCYRRVLGEAGPHETFTGRGTHWRGTRTPRVGVQDDQAANRVHDMDDEGTDAHFLVPTLW